jgi:hypothetical protein
MRFLYPFEPYINYCHRCPAEISLVLSTLIFPLYTGGLSGDLSASLILDGRDQSNLRAWSKL